MITKAIATAKITDFNNPKVSEHPKGISYGAPVRLRSKIRNPISQIEESNHPKSEIRNPKSIYLKNMTQAADKADEARLEKACKDFEAIILNQMLSAMRKTVPEGGLFEKSFSENIYQSMMDEELSKKIAHGKGMGLGEMLFRQLTDKK